jgi:hypothetical protein
VLAAPPMPAGVAALGTPGHRLIELLIGLALTAYCAYEIYTGEARGAWRSYERAAEPWSYWTSMVLKLAIAFAFLFGYTAWRD